jgi:flavin-dependent dehydrogenase
MDAAAAGIKKTAGLRLLSLFGGCYSHIILTIYGNLPLHALQGQAVRGRVLVCADGSTSRLATQLGYCIAPPQVCTWLLALLLPEFAFFG